MRNILIRNLEVEEIPYLEQRICNPSECKSLKTSLLGEEIEPIDWHRWVSGEEEINFGFPKSISQLFRDVFAKTMMQPLEDLQVKNRDLASQNQHLQMKNQALMTKKGVLHNHINKMETRLTEITEAGLWQRIKFVFTKKI